jgi:hypothetical protein
MAKHTHLVVSYNHDTKTFTFDGDGSREWIRSLFDPATNTWSDEQGEYVSIPTADEQEAVDALEAIGVLVEEDGWQTR